DLGNLNRALAHGNAPRELAHRRFRSSLVEHVQFIIARGSVDMKGPILAGGIEVPGVEYYDNGAHGRVDIAKDPNHARSREANGPIGSWRVETDVEDLPAVAGKRAVEDGIEVRQVDCGTGRNG